MSSFGYGMMVSISLIVAIGAQNVFLIRNGIARNHALLIALICFLCDVVLMSLGILCTGTVSQLSVVFKVSMAWIASVFLAIYSLFSFRKALMPSAHSTIVAEGGVTRTSASQAVLMTLAITLLNPHVYLDTMVLLGGVAASLTFQEKLAFLAGALVASGTWFFCLGHYSRYLLRFFRTPLAWRVFDFGVAIVMAGLALSMWLYGYHTAIAAW